MSDKQVTEAIQNAVETAKKYWEEKKAKNNIPSLRIKNRNIFSEFAIATAEPLEEMMGEVGGYRKEQLLYPQEAVIVLLGAAEYIQSRYVDKLRR